jgi:hypothetical protein
MLDSETHQKRRKHGKMTIYLANWPDNIPWSFCLLHSQFWLNLVGYNFSHRPSLDDACCLPRGEESSNKGNNPRFAAVLPND